MWSHLFQSCMQFVTRTSDFLSFLSRLLSFWTSQKERRRTRLFVVLINCSLLKNLDIIIFFIILFITAVTYVITDNINQFLILFSFITRLWSWWNPLLFVRQFRKRLTISVLLQDCDCRRISFFLFFSRLREKSSSFVCFLWFRNYQKKIMNRSLNIEKARSMTAVSQIRSDFSMSSRYEDFFQKSRKSSRA
jgi:hypothetical protein